MSVIGYPDTNVLDLQVWDNAAFDNGEEYALLPIKQSWSSMPSIDQSESFELDSSKENQSPGFCISPVCEKSPVPIKPLGPNNTAGNLKGQPLKVLFKQGLLNSTTVSEVGCQVACDDSKLDAEIEEVEMEMNRLSLKLESLRLEKSRRDSMKVEVPPRVVVGKALGQKQTYKPFLVPRKIEATPANSRRRGVTMGPSEILEGIRSQQKGKQEVVTPNQRKNGRGISLGPSEILADAGSQKRGKQELTPIQSTQQNRRKSCFLKLQEINEEKVTKERGGGRSVSLSPKSRIARIQASRQGFTTISSKKSAKKEEQVINSIQPRKLFKEGEKMVATTRKPTKVGRVIASRYNQNVGNFTETTRRKMSLPGSDRGEIKKSDRKRPSSVGKSTESELAILNEELGNPSQSLLKVVDFLPKIRTIRRTNDTPRDSGPAKKVAELIGKKSYFATADAEDSVCQVLSFNDQEEEQ